MKKFSWFILALLIILLDQGSKHWALASLSPYQPEPVIPMLNLTLAYNTGAAFSFLSNAGVWHKWFFVLFSLGMSIFLTVWIIRSPSSAHLQLTALTLILGGALGNLVDRVVLGYVIDFIDVYYHHYHWPVFNLADCAISLGALLLFIDFLKNQAADSGLSE
ncbi:signal peptidase II [Legionella londiniensis]|uniref:Lipoprotein signal peptidase n=1 Tax=Legionella londiniensis TaxID=45068 RepID=A0A0W0VR39_9GAMM|nr:signal peptidase II [Legionella londiniensis]KTD22413.1 lipoprotein signal peptidase [Legionella londiniensis]STX93013.1 signal peptidase II [Legionella londiniensis]